MARRIIEALRIIARELIEKGYESDDTVKRLNVLDIDFLSIRDELADMENVNDLDEDELDTIRALLAYILMKDTELDSEEIYSFVFGKGRQILWN